MTALPSGPRSMPKARPVVLTRAAEDNVALAAALRSRGLPVVEWPALDTRPVDLPGGAAAIEEAVGRCAVICFTSRRGVEAALERVPGLPSLLSTRLVAAIGPATAAALRSRGVEARWTAGGSGSRALASLLADSAPPGARVLLLRSRAADGALPDQLVASGFTVEDIRVHEPVEPARPAAEPQPLAAIVCASPSAARQVIAWHPWAVSAPFVAIGETTRSALEALGVSRVGVASAPTVEALADAVVAIARISDEEGP